MDILCRALSTKTDNPEAKSCLLMMQSFLFDRLCLSDHYYWDIGRAK